MTNMSKTRRTSLKPGDAIAYEWGEPNDWHLCWAIFDRIEKGTLFVQWIKPVWCRNAWEYYGDARKYTGIKHFRIVDADTDAILADFTAWRLTHDAQCGG